MDPDTVGVLDLGSEWISRLIVRASNPHLTLTCRPLRVGSPGVTGPFQNVIVQDCEQ